MINSEGVRIEVKSTVKPKSFRYNSVSINTRNQYKNVIFKVLIDKKGQILMYKFVKKENKSWLDITEKIINFKWNLIFLKRADARVRKKAGKEKIQLQCGLSP